MNDFRNAHAHFLRLLSHSLTVTCAFFDAIGVSRDSISDASRLQAVSRNFETAEGRCEAARRLRVTPERCSMSEQVPIVTENQHRAGASRRSQCLDLDLEGATESQV